MVPVTTAAFDFEDSFSVTVTVTVDAAHASKALDDSGSVIVTNCVIVEVVVGVDVIVLVFVAIGDSTAEPWSSIVVYSTMVEVVVIGSIRPIASARLIALATSSEAVAGTVKVVEGKVIVMNLSIVTVVS